MSLHIVLYKPSIIENVGNIARTCVAFNCDLHMIRPYGFIWNKSKLKRSSTNHFDLINVYEYDAWEDFLNINNNQNKIIYYYSRYGKKSPNEFKYNLKQDIYLVFGNEHYGIDKEILKTNLDTCIRIPISNKLICLNISNSVAIACYEVLKQSNYEDLEKLEFFNKEW